MPRRLARIFQSEYASQVLKLTEHAAIYVLIS